MNRLVGNIWDAPPGTAICIPTNVGWKRDGSNVMGRGVALQASRRYPTLAAEYGHWCMFHGAELFIVPSLSYGDNRRLVCFPVKPPATNPALSWRQPADLGLINHSTIALSERFRHTQVWLPLVGCGNGGLAPADVLPILDRYLDDRFTLVTMGTLPL